MPELRARFTADDSQLTRKLNGMQGMMGRLSGRIAGLFGVAAVSRFANEITRAAESISSISDVTGIRPRSLQAFQALAEDAGVAGERVEATINKIAQARFDALSDPASAAAKSFAELNISAERLASMSIEQTIEAIGRAAADAGDDYGKLAALSQFVEVRSRRVLGVMKELGRSGFDEIAQKADKAGAVMDDSTVRGLNNMRAAVSHGARVAKAQGGEFLGYLGKMVGLSPEDFTDEDQRLAERTQRLRSMRESAWWNEPGRAETKRESALQRKLREASEAVALRQNLATSGISSEMIRIGGARGVGVDVANQQLSVMRSMDNSLKALVGQEGMSLRW